MGIDHIARAHLPTCEIGSKPNRGEPAVNFCHDCRPSIPAITPTNCFERSSAG
ncbi:hypothetical protein GGD56_003469 [Rhizobium mongolense]|uniref:Uncharacterized protein n=1 Tax=Rhizobium mongolense TaxID=57676 RepID=A0ABR6IP04_9HYPH|nr:hypothetical protein [Rhizobium mongolense]